MTEFQPGDKVKKKNAFTLFGIVERVFKLNITGQEYTIVLVDTNNGDYAINANMLEVYED